jgi:hypothetical protein
VGEANIPLAELTEHTNRCLAFVLRPARHDAVSLACQVLVSAQLVPRHRQSLGETMKILHNAALDSDDVRNGNNVSLMDVSPLTTSAQSFSMSSSLSYVMPSRQVLSKLSAQPRNHSQQVAMPVLQSICLRVGRCELIDTGDCYMLIMSIREPRGISRSFYKTLAIRQSVKHLTNT